MAIVKRGEKTYLVRVFIGYDPITKKRIEINETVRGSLPNAKRREAQLKAQKHSGRLVRSPRMTLDALFDYYLDSKRHTLSVVTHYKYNDIYRRYAGPYIGSIPIAKIKRGDIQRLLNFLLDPKEEDDGDEE